MFHMIDHTSIAEGAVLRAMFEARKAVFVDLLKWDVPVLGGTWELDQFDDDDARYIVLTDAQGRHLGSTRLLKTTQPHILDTLFPDLCEEAVPSGPDVFEITRFCLDRNLRASERREVRNRLVTALAEHALDAGIRRYTGVAEMAWFQQILSFGWRCMPLGLPRMRDRTMLAAIEIQIDADTPRMLTEAGIWASLAAVMPLDHRAA